jgi:hypothetical protein
MDKERRDWKIAPALSIIERMVSQNLLTAVETALVGVLVSVRRGRKWRHMEVS